jgi:transcription antitermination factor NusG
MLMSESGISDQWYAIYARHQHEKTISHNLQGKGFQTLLPLHRSAHQWKDRTKIVSLPLFPCYVFVKGGLERRLEILTTPGIFGLVSSAGRPVPIPSPELEAFRKIMEVGTHVEPHPFLNAGDLVKIKCGPLAGIQGILVRRKNGNRLILSVEMLGKAAALELDGLLIERSGSRSRANDQ